MSHVQWRLEKSLPPYSCQPGAQLETGTSIICLRWARVRWRVEHWHIRALDRKWCTSFLLTFYFPGPVRWLHLTSKGWGIIIVPVLGRRQELGLECMSHVYHRGRETPTHSNIPPPRRRYNEKLVLDGSRAGIFPISIYSCILYLCSH